MKLLADLHISPSTVTFLRQLGHDVVRVNEVMSAKARDTEIIAEAERQQRTVLTQDLDFSAIVALRGLTQPSIVSLRLSSSRIEGVNAILERVLPALEPALSSGAIVAVEDTRTRCRNLPIG